MTLVAALRAAYSANTARMASRSPRHHGKNVGERVGQRCLRVGDARVDRLQRVLAREAAFALAETQVGAHEAHQVDRVAGVEHGEARAQPDDFSVLLQQPMGDGMERAAPHPSRGVRVGVARGARDQLVRGAAAEREQQQAGGVGALVDEAGEPGGQRGGLAGAGPRNDQEGPPFVLDRRALRLVEDEHAFEMVAEHDVRCVGSLRLHCFAARSEKFERGRRRVVRRQQVLVRSADAPHSVRTPDSWPWPGRRPTGPRNKIRLGVRGVAR